MTDLYTARLPVLWENVSRPLLWRGQKAPGDVRQYQLDCSSWMPVGDSIATVSVGVTPNGSGDIVATAPLAAASTIAGVILAGGNPGTLYAVTFTVSTLGGDVLVRTVWLFCQNLSPALLVPPTVQAVVPAVLPPLVVVNGVVALDPVAFGSFMLAWLATDPDAVSAFMAAWINALPALTSLPTPGWKNNGGVAQLVTGD